MATSEPLAAAPAVAGTAEQGPEITADPDQIVLEQDEDDGDSALGDDWQSETTSLASSIVRGYTENGRRYQTTKEGQYWGPSDDKQFDTMELSHLVLFILDSEQENQYFHSPIGKNPQNILDVGAGDGTWAIEIADKYPEASVIGVDLYPPPAAWVPPNCVFQVDDVTEPWTFKQKFDFIHMRLLYGAFTEEEAARVYKAAYDNLVPGGWFENLEWDININSDDDSIDPTGPVAQFGPIFLGCSFRSGRPLDTQTKSVSYFKNAGFVDVVDKLYKAPIGGWAKNKIYKDAGRVNREHWNAGLEGWAMWLLTKYGLPTPWLAEEVHVYVAKVREGINDPKIHGYHYARRVWGRKPLNA